MLLVKKICTMVLAAVLVTSAISVCADTENSADAAAIVEKSVSSQGNLIANSSFEDNSNWSSGANIFRSSDKAHNGSYSAKCNARGMSVAVSATQNISVAQNTDYILSGYVYRNDNSTWAYIDMNDRTGEVQLLDISTSGKWQYVSGVWNSGSSTSLQVRLVVEPNYTINQHLKEGITGDCWFDDVTLTPVNYGSYSEEPPVLSSQKQEFLLENSDIKVTVASDKNKEYLNQILNKNNNFNWINNTAEVSLPQPLGADKIAWILTNSSLDNTNPLNGTGKNACHTLSFTYTSNYPRLTLTSYWKIYPTGPLYHYSEIQNNTGEEISFNANDISATDVLLKIPDNVQIYRFNRSRYNNGFDGLFTTGVFKTEVGNSLFLKSSVENSWLLSSGSLPFEILQGDNHGLYVGYEWSYGQMLMRTQNNKNLLRFYADLGYSSDVIQRQNGEILLVPPVFYGAYSGNADDGSNNMKSWFYNHLMTASLRENANEPLIEFHLPLFSESDLVNYLNNNNLEQYGVELTKMDYWWTVPGDAFDADLEQKWNPDYSKWPNGMTYGKLVKNKFPSIKTSLYMCDTYQGVDIGTKEGRQLQINALTQRMNDWKIDYWRSDFDILKPNNYQNHEGLMNVLDTMIANNKDFRYEHCSAGGSLKDFATLQRMTFMTMEDSGGALNHRMAFYSNSYMINPVQLKFDMGFDWTSTQDAPYIGNNQQKWTTYNVRTAMLGAMMVQNVSGSLSEIQKTELIKGWNLYKTRQRPILRGANVYHILPMPDGKNWDGIQYYNKNLEKGSVFLFRDKNINATDGSSKNIRLQGLDADTEYFLEFQDRSEQNKIVSGSELMNSGITVTGMNSVYDSEIIWISKAIPPEPTTAPATTVPTPPVTTQPSSQATSAPVTVPSTQSTSPTSISLSGDANSDGNVNISDVTYIQKHIAKIYGFEQINFVQADTNNDSEINIKDATIIQKVLAGIV